MVHEFKRMKVSVHGPPVSSVESASPTSPIELKRKLPSGRSSPMEVDEALQRTEVKKKQNEEKRKEMMEMLQSQLREYKNQYTNISQGWDIAPCHSPN